MVCVCAYTFFAVLYSVISVLSGTLKRMISPEDKVRLTKQRFSNVDLLKAAVLEGEYSSDCAFFSRPFLWESVCNNTYGLNFKDDELLKVPKEGEEEDITDISHVKEELVRNSTENDPLSFDSDILDMMKLDIDRLLINPLFHEEHVKQDILQIMYNYNRFQPYKQGYHELCGIIYLQLYKENPDLHKSQIKIQTFNIFSSMMITLVPNFYDSDNLVGWCVSIFNKYLRLIDPPLYDLLIKTHKIESQVWLIRWVRLAFSREIGLDNTVKLWDFMLCYDHDFSKLFPFLIILFLMKLKLRIAECDDNGEVLYLLLHYPHTELSNEEVKTMIQWSIKFLTSPEDKLESLGTVLSKKLHKGIRWDKVKDLDRIKLELKLKRRVQSALKP